MVYIKHQIPYFFSSTCTLYLNIYKNKQVQVHDNVLLMINSSKLLNANITHRAFGRSY
jgi:hypothetical protein